MKNNWITKLFAAVNARTWQPDDRCSNCMLYYIEETWKHVNSSPYPHRLMQNTFLSYILLFYLSIQSHFIKIYFLLCYTIRRRIRIFYRWAFQSLFANNCAVQTLNCVIYQIENVKSGFIRICTFANSPKWCVTFRRVHGFVHGFR